MGTFPKYTFGLQYFTRIKVDPNDCNAEPSMAFLGWMAQVQVDKLPCGCDETQFNLFFGIWDQLIFDLAHW